MRPRIFGSVLMVALIAGCGGNNEVNNDGNSCVPDEKSCHATENKVMTCGQDGRTVYVESCPQGSSCQSGACVDQNDDCVPETLRCNDKLVERCDLAGRGWDVIVACEPDQTCAEGVCLDKSCTPGEKQCASDAVFICAADGGSWERNVCPEATRCVFGGCLECINDDGCHDGLICEQGVCIEPTVEILTTSLPDASEGASYFASLEASGIEPYTWQHTGGSLPEGVALNAATGTISGTPTTMGDYDFTVSVTDKVANSDSQDLSITVLGPGLHVASPAYLPMGQEGFAYFYQLQATGGIPPYAWMIADGKLPAGLELFADGRIAGAPTEIGNFPMTVRVFSNQSTPDSASKSVNLQIAMAPLEIIGDPEFNLLVTKIIILDLFIPYIPYSTQLEARGGLKPYTWTEEEVPQLMAMPLLLAGIDTSTWGLSDEMSLQPDGSISAWMTNVDDATTITIPVLNTDVTGYFFFGQVADSQNPPKTQTAVFVIPTVPL